MKKIMVGHIASLLLLAGVLVPHEALAQAQPAAARPATAAPVAGPASTEPPPAPAPANPKGLQGTPVAVSATPTPKKPGAEGLKVHGHWIIDLRNADGTIAEHRDFENSLLGPTALLQILSGQYVTGDFGITIASTGASVCSAITGDIPLGSCLIAASSTAGLGGNTCIGAAAGVCNYNLQDVVGGGNGGTGAISLSGTMPVVTAGAVTQVGTQIFVCTGGSGPYSTVDPVGCYNQTEGGSYQYGNLTGASITPLNVTEGQTLAFTVVLTFS